MKILSLALLLMASIAFVMLGCSDNPSSVVAPTDQAGPQRAPGAFGKFSETPFTGREIITEVLNWGEEGNVGVRISWHGFEFISYYETSDPRVTGFAHVWADFNLDYNFEGPLHGKVTIYPSEVEDGLWEGTFQGYRTARGTEYLENVLHGKGGSIHGMQLFISEVWGPAGRGIGIVTGNIQSH